MIYLELLTVPSDSPHDVGEKGRGSDVTSLLLFLVIFLGLQFFLLLLHECYGSPCFK